MTAGSVGDKRGGILNLGSTCGCSLLVDDAGGDGVGRGFLAGGSWWLFWDVVGGGPGVSTSFMDL